MTFDTLGHLGRANRQLLERRERLFESIGDLDLKLWWRRPCQVRLLVLTDGNLSFSPVAGFGLTDFVTALLEGLPYARFRITLAHIRGYGATDPRMMPDETRIAERIGGFKFDNPAHFGVDRYDAVFLFGFDPDYGTSRGAGYPADSLSDAELQRIGEFQNAGGGVFATGDHGSLGRALCHKIPRVRNMRLWQSTNNQLGEDMVSMLGRYRNDTNRRGHDGSWQFDDQSDDIPQEIIPTIYTVGGGVFRYSFPHPLLCGPNGVIRVMPDHPHEGECRLPDDLSQPIGFTAPLGAEYPMATGGGGQVVPEIVSRNQVPAGNAGSGPTGVKQATEAQTFPGIAAYDGHRAGVGRVVTDATWHHFVNVNLTGDVSYPTTNPKRYGLLATPAGALHYEQIKVYFRNLAVWLARPERISCMNVHLMWRLVNVDHVLESILTASKIGIDKVSPYVLFAIGRHARDVLGRYASPCQAMRLVIDIVDERIRKFPDLDPWQVRERPRPIADLPLPVLDGLPLVDASFGGALVQLGATLAGLAPERLERLGDADMLEVARKGAAIGFDSGRDAVAKALERDGRQLLG